MSLEDLIKTAALSENSKELLELAKRHANINNISVFEEALTYSGDLDVNAEFIVRFYQLFNPSSMIQTILYSERYDLMLGLLSHEEIFTRCPEDKEKLAKTIINSRNEEMINILKVIDYDLYESNTFKKY